VNLIAKPPSPDEVHQVRELHETGLPAGAIAHRVFGNSGQMQVVQAILREPDERFDEFVDEVAVARGLNGDPGIWEQATYRERLEIVRRAQEARSTDELDGLGDAPAWLWRVAVAAGFRDTKEFLTMAAKLRRRGAW
jgi:hypothetical protein